MGVSIGNGRIWLFGSVLAVALPVLAPSGFAATEPNSSPPHKMAHTTQHVQVAHHNVTPTAHNAVAQTAHHYVTRTGYANLRLASAHGYSSRGRRASTAT